MGYITPYDQFVNLMEDNGLIKEFTILEEKDVDISDNDEAIYVTVGKSYMISIKGLRESSARGKIISHPHYMSIKIYGNDGQEVLSEDAVQFSITEFKRAGLPTLPESRSHIVYYNYPYSIASSKLRFKRGIVITKDRRLEIRIIRNNVPLKIGKIDLKMECDKWFKKEGD